MSVLLFIAPLQNAVEFHVFTPCRLSDNADLNGEDTSSLSSEEEKEADQVRPASEPILKPSWASGPKSMTLASVKREEEEDEDNEEEEGSCLPTIYFSHTVEPKKVRLRPKNWTQAFVSAFNLSIFLFFLLQVRINTGKNTTLKFSERKEQKEHSKKKKKNGHANGHGHAHHDFHKITTPADIYR